MLKILQVHSEAFDVLFSRYRRVLHFVAYRLLCDHKDAEDAVQSFFVSVSNNVQRFECEGSFRRARCG
jgi:DNA-directed RNA polymerase specialized sigma24 family protein